jgi:hypothetical protein
VVWHHLCIPKKNKKGKEITKILFHLKNLEYVCGIDVIINQKKNKNGLQN